MPDFLKGNYQVPETKGRKGPAKGSKKRQEEGELTTKLEEAALSILGGSMAFVMKGNTFIWKGGEGEEAGPGTD